MNKDGSLKKELVLRCPNASDSCTYPDCNHELKEPEMFTRTTKGSPISAVKDIVKSMTFKEVVEMAKGLGIPPFLVDDWAHDKLQDAPPPPPPPAPQPANDNALSTNQSQISSPQ